QLVLEKSGRKITYSRLRVTDANDKELPARMDVIRRSAQAAGDTPMEATETAELAVVVNDAVAVYPLRIDPTFSDANWMSMGGILGTDGAVNAVVSDSFGNVYIGGQFTMVDDVLATNIARWNGSKW